MGGREREVESEKRGERSEGEGRSGYEGETRCSGGKCKEGEDGKTKKGRGKFVVLTSSQPIAKVLIF